MNIIERLQLIVDEKCDGSRRGFAMQIGVSPATIDNILGKRASAPSVEVLERVYKNIEGISPEWLLSGVDKVDMLARGHSGDGIPLYRTEAAAGFGTEGFSVEDKDIEAYYKIKELQNANFMLHVRGDSMSPSYNNGDIIAVKEVLDVRNIQWGKIHLISSRDHGLLIKRIYDDGSEVIAVSDNPTYKPIIINKEDVGGVAFVMGSVRFDGY